MSVQEFNCPNCGAPLDYDGSSATVRCSFCDTSVMVPPELRQKPPTRTYPPAGSKVQIEINRPEGSAAIRSRRRGCLVGITLTSVALFILGLVAIPMFLSWRSDQMAASVMDPADLLKTQMAEEALATPTLEPSEIPPSPTPSFAQLVTTFGEQGIGPGLLNRAEYLSIDGSGTVYVADYQDGRIQAFDASGKYLHGWQVGDENTFIHGMAAAHDGTLYVAYDGDINRFTGSTGEPLGKLDYANGPEFGDLAVLTDGGVAGVWYEGRWGIITSLAGHRDDLVWFDSKGKTTHRLESFISGQTGYPALDTKIAIDGLGTVYALSTDQGVIFKFNSQGKFIDRIDPQGGESSGLSRAECITVDGRGRVYIGGGKQVAIYSPEGRFLMSFPTDEQVQAMAFNMEGDLYTLSGETVSRYTLGLLP